MWTLLGDIICSVIDVSAQSKCILSASAFLSAGVVFQSSFQPKRECRSYVQPDCESPMLIKYFHGGSVEKYIQIHWPTRCYPFMCWIKQITWSIKIKTLVCWAAERLSGRVQPTSTDLSFSSEDWEWTLKTFLINLHSNLRSHIEGLWADFVDVVSFLTSDRPGRIKVQHFTWRTTKT